MNLFMRPFRRLKPLVSRIRPRLGLSNDVRDACARSWVISPAMQSIAPAAIFEPRDLAKITGTGWPTRTIADELAQAAGGTTDHAATVAYELHDAVISRGHLFTMRSYLRISNLRAPLITPASSRAFEDAALATSHFGFRFFGHWLMDDLPRLLAARKTAPPISLLTRPSPNQRGYLDLLGLQVEAVDEATFERIVVIDDVGQNRDKIDRYRQLRELAFNRFPGRTGSRVMLLRGNSGEQRMLANEAELAAVLKGHGFVVLDPMQLDAHELMDACVGAEIVVGVEGSHLLNGVMWMSAGGALLVIQPPNRFQMIVKAACDSIGVRYAFVVADPAPDAAFRVDVGAVERLLERLLAH